MDFLEIDYRIKAAWPFFMSECVCVCAHVSASENFLCQRLETVADDYKI